MTSKELLLFLTYFALVLIGPFISIWSINILFGLGISYSIETWLGVLWLQLIFSSKIAGK